MPSRSVRASLAPQLAPFIRVFSRNAESEILVMKQSKASSCCSINHACIRARLHYKDALPCLCFAKTGSIPNASAPWNIELVPPSAPSAHCTPQHHPSARRARVSRVSRRRTRPQCVPNLQSSVLASHMYLRTLRLNLAFMGLCFDPKRKGGCWIHTASARTTPLRPQLPTPVST